MSRVKPKARHFPIRLLPSAGVNYTLHLNRQPAEILKSGLGLGPLRTFSHLSSEPASAEHARVQCISGTTARLSHEKYE
jgi:hypothetical protein